MITSSGSHDEIRHTYRLFITRVGLDETISIGLELVVVANHTSKHIGSSVCLQGHQMVKIYHRLDSLRRQLQLDELAALIAPSQRISEGVKLTGLVGWAWHYCVARWRPHSMLRWRQCRDVLPPRFSCAGACSLLHVRDARRR